MPMTVAQYRKQYSHGCWIQSWPQLGYKAIIKPFTFEEYNDIIQRAIKFTREELGFQYTIDYFMDAPPPEPLYAGIVRKHGFEAFNGAYDEHQAQMDSWAKDRPQSPILTKGVYDNNSYIGSRIMKYPDEPGGLVFWITKVNSNRITFQFYRYENGGNEKFCNEFLKLSTRYVLDDGWH